MACHGLDLAGAGVWTGSEDRATLRLFELGVASLRVEKATVGIGWAVSSYDFTTWNSVWRFY